MTKEEFMQNLHIKNFNGVYSFPYREKSVLEFIEEEKNGQVKIDEKCVEYFYEEINNIEDGEEIFIHQIGELSDTEETIYSVSMKTNNGIEFNRLFREDFHNDKTIELLINSLCKVLYDNSCKKANVKFLIFWDEETFNDYYNDYMEEVE